MPILYFQSIFLLHTTCYRCYGEKLRLSLWLMWVNLVTSVVHVDFFYLSLPREWVFCFYNQFWLYNLAIMSFITSYACQWG